MAGVVGAGVLVYLGRRRRCCSAFRIRLGGETGDELATPKRAFVVALGATASNPLTIASWAAVFAAASTAGATEGAAVLALLAGVGLGSLTWMVLLTGGVSLARRYVGDRASASTAWRASACSASAACSPSARFATDARLVVPAGSTADNPANAPVVDCPRRTPHRAWWSCAAAAGSGIGSYRTLPRLRVTANGAATRGRERRATASLSGRRWPTTSPLPSSM